MVECVHRNSLDENTRRFVPDEVFESIEEARDVVEFLMTRYESSEGPFVYPFLLKNGENIGYVQVVTVEEGWEIGYHIAKEYTCNGYTTEAVKSFLPIIMEKLHINCLYGICHIDNIASQRVLSKSGFTLFYEGISKYQGEKQMVCKYKYCI